MGYSFIYIEEEYKKLNPTGRLAINFQTIELKGKIDFNTSDEDVLKFLRSRMDEAIQGSQSLLSFDAGASSTSQNSPIVCPKPTVRVRGWNQAGKVGGGGTVGAFQPEMARGWGPLISAQQRTAKS